MPSYYHHGRVGSLSGPGANGAYYEQMAESVPSSAALGSSAMAAVAYQQQQPQQDPFAVGPPLTLGGSTMPATVVTSNGRLRNPVRSTSKSGKMMSSSSSSRLGAAAYSVQPPTSMLPTPRASSGAWSPQDDDALLQARSRGENWAQIQIQFPGKTPNACRKRHERLMERRNATNDFDARKMEQIAREYMHLRREMWQPLAQRTGEKWTVVEAKCMTAGLKNLQGVSRSSSRRLRIESGYAAGHPGDLSGMGYVEDDMHPSMVVGSNGHAHLLSAGSADDFVEGAHEGSSPGGSTTGGGNRSVSGGSNSSTVSVRTTAPHPSASSRQHHHAHSHSYSHTGPAPQQDIGSPGTYQDYYTTTTGFSQSLRALDGAGAPNGTGASMVSPYMSHHHGQHAAPQHQGQRLSPDMGIDSLLHRG
ncbi:hypothetical protein SEUCBS139899_007986 [Sporothrix eucalyptigena]|uniref:Myb-like domain-containing protein n=1 Tax=Sporothrix eucalyptigena TaxID=1812306 RepID=A0ABP0D2U3_9PEZI